MGILSDFVMKLCHIIFDLVNDAVGELQCNAMLPCGLSDLQKWACLCLHKLCEEFPQAKNVCLTEAGSGHLQLHHLLVDGDSRVSLGHPMCVNPFRLCESICRFEQLQFWH